MRCFHSFSLGEIGASIRSEEYGQGITHLRMWSSLSRMTGMEVSAYLVSDILIDTGFHFVSELIAQRCEKVKINAIALTHHHEDHAGNAGKLAKKHHCPVYLRSPSASGDEGVSDLRLYRRIWWGPTADYSPIELPEILETKGARLRAIPAPGHSRTHTVLLDENSGIAFTGDLYVSSGATAVMSHENPYESVLSLRKIADLDPEKMATGHGLFIERPAVKLRAKADKIEEVAQKVLELRKKGYEGSEIVESVFDKGKAKDRFMTWMTEKEFSRQNFVDACIAHRPRAVSELNDI